MNSQKTNTLAIVGFILSFFLGPVGGIISIIALCQIKNTMNHSKFIKKGYWYEDNEKEDLIVEFFDR